MQLRQIPWLVAARVTAWPGCAVAATRWIRVSHQAQMMLITG